MEQTDIQLIEEIAEGNESAFSALFDKYRQMVYCQVYRLVLNEDDSLDIVQDCFIKLLHVIENKRGHIQNLGAFLRKMALNQALDHLRSRKRRYVFQKLLKSDVSSNYIKDDPTDKISQGELHKELMQAVIKLSPLQQKVICLRHFEDLRISEIADICGCSIGAVKQHLHRGYRKLRKLINRKNVKAYLQPELKMEYSHVSAFHED